MIEEWEDIKKMMNNDERLNEILETCKSARGTKYDIPAALAALLARYAEKQELGTDYVLYCFLQSAMDALYYVEK